MVKRNPLFQNELERLFHLQKSAKEAYEDYSDSKFAERNGIKKVTERSFINAFYQVVQAEKSRNPQDDSQSFRGATTRNENLMDLPPRIKAEVQEPFSSLYEGDTLTAWRQMNSFYIRYQLIAFYQKSPFLEAPDPKCIGPDLTSLRWYIRLYRMSADAEHTATDDSALETVILLRVLGSEMLATWEKLTLQNIKCDRPKVESLFFTEFWRAKNPIEVAKISLGPGYSSGVKKYDDSSHKPKTWGGSSFGEQWNFIDEKSNNIIQVLWPSIGLFLDVPEAQRELFSSGSRPSLQIYLPVGTNLQIKRYPLTFLYYNYKELLDGEDDLLNYPADFVTSPILRNWSKQAAAYYSKAEATKQTIDIKQNSKEYSEEDLKLISIHNEELLDQSARYFESQRSY